MRAFEMNSGNAWDTLCKCCCDRINCGLAARLRVGDKCWQKSIRSQSSMGLRDDLKSLKGLVIIEHNAPPTVYLQIYEPRH